jgi:phosphate transport system substrate-binding protein
MKKNIIAKTVISLLVSVILLFCGFVLAFIAALSGKQIFYPPYIMITDVILIVFLWLKVFNAFTPKKRRIAFLLAFVICISAIATYEIREAYHDKITIANEQGVDLNQYKPFIKNTKAVKLEEKSSLRIEGDLPRLDGATALYPLYSAFAQAVYPEKDYELYNSEVMCSNTREAYDSLINGYSDIIFTARPSQQQIDMAKDRGVELKLTPIGREAFVFFVNSKNKVTDLTKKQIQDIYSGGITNWKEVGGEDEKIRAFQRPENSGSQTMLQKFMEGKKLMTPPKADIAMGMGEIINETASYRNYKNSIGYSFLFFSTEMVQNNKIKLLKVDGIYPDKETIKNKTYPLSAEFYAVTAGSRNPNIQPLIEWILSKQGQYLIGKTGYTPY